MGAFLPTGMSGWMMKCNLLVRCDRRNNSNADGQEAEVGPEDEKCLGQKCQCEVMRGYQILSLDFERSAGGRVKVWGARRTQKVPVELASFGVSSGRSGKTSTSAMLPGTPYECVVRGKHPGGAGAAGEEKGSNASLIELLGGALRDWTVEGGGGGEVEVGVGRERPGQALVDFVLQRPHKFLLQPTREGGTSAVYAWHPTPPRDRFLSVRAALDLAWEGRGWGLGRERYLITTTHTHTHYYAGGPPSSATVGIQRAASSCSPGGWCSPSSRAFSRRSSCRRRSQSTGPCASCSRSTLSWTTTTSPSYPTPVLEDNKGQAE